MFDAVEDSDHKLGARQESGATLNIPAMRSLSVTLTRVNAVPEPKQRTDIVCLMGSSKIEFYDSFTLKFMLGF